MAFTNERQLNGGQMGSGSGLDADMTDGKDSAQLKTDITPLQAQMNENIGAIAETQFNAGLALLNYKDGQYWIFESGANDSGIASQSSTSLTDGNLVLEILGYDLTVASYDSSSYAMGAGYTRGIFFKPDGTKAFRADGNGDNIESYNLSTAWDLSTGSAGTTFDVSGQTLAPQGVVFDDDGTKMFVVDGAGDNIYSYSLGTAWDISTASSLSSISVGTETSAPEGMAFNDDGTKMFLIGDAGVVYSYSLSTAYDLSTASYLRNFNASTGTTETNFRGMAFNDDGTKMFTVGLDNTSVYSYSLSTAYDLSTASNTGNSYSVGTQETAPEGVAFKPDGSKMYAAGNGSDTLYQYTTSSGTATSGTATFSSKTYSSTPTSIVLSDEAVLNGNSRSYDVMDGTGTVLTNVTASELDDEISISPSNATLQVKAKLSGDGASTPEIDKAEIAVNY